MWTISSQQALGRPERRDSYCSSSPVFCWLVADGLGGRDVGLEQARFTHEYFSPDPVKMLTPVVFGTCRCVCCFLL